MLFTRQIAKILAKYIEIRKRRKIRSCTILEEFLKPQLSILSGLLSHTTHNALWGWAMLDKKNTKK